MIHYFALCSVTQDGWLMLSWTHPLKIIQQLWCSEENIEPSRSFQYWKKHRWVSCFIRLLGSTDEDGHFGDFNTTDIPKPKDITFTLKCNKEMQQTVPSLSSYQSVRRAERTYLSPEPAAALQVHWRLEEFDTETHCSNLHKNKSRRKRQSAEFFLQAMADLYINDAFQMMQRLLYVAELNYIIHTVLLHI